MGKRDSKYITEWKKENCKCFNVFIRGDENSDLIEGINEQKEWGYSNNEIVRIALKEYYESEKNNGKKEIRDRGSKTEQL